MSSTHDPSEPEPQPAAGRRRLNLKPRDPAAAAKLEQERLQSSAKVRWPPLFARDERSMRFWTVGVSRACIGRWVKGIPTYTAQCYH